ncbi:MOSC domain-containing protein [Nocardioides fonticola]|uniref:MOSC domain-containing protein n=1 Tax=Nocardioides fonticola TaxID=450363 RepID=A0ABP7X9G2_9ACTN
MSQPAVPVVVALHTAKGRRLPMQAKAAVEVEAGAGIVGDRYHGSKHRHVTVQSASALAEAEGALQRPIPPDLTRRNITISSGAVPTTPGVRLRVGETLLEVVRVAAPCRLLDDELGPGAMEALRRRAGTVFRVLEGGRIAVGDGVEVVSETGG